MFTKEHYQVLSAILKSAKQVPHENVHYHIMTRMVEHLKADNPHFNERNFLTACGVPEEVLRYLPN